MGQTTGSTQIKLKTVSKQNKALAAENENQAAELNKLERENSDMAAQLAALQKEMATLTAAPPPKSAKKVTLFVTPMAPDNMHFKSNKHKHSVLPSAARVGKPD